MSSRRRNATDQRPVEDTVPLATEGARELVTSIARMYLAAHMAEEHPNVPFAAAPLGGSLRSPPRHAEPQQPEPIIEVRTGGYHSTAYTMMRNWWMTGLWSRHSEMKGTGWQVSAHDEHRHRSFFGRAALHTRLIPLTAASECIAPVSVYADGMGSMLWAASLTCDLIRPSLHEPVLPEVLMTMHAFPRCPWKPTLNGLHLITRELVDAYTLNGIETLPMAVGQLPVTHGVCAYTTGGVESYFVPKRGREAIADVLEFLGAPLCYAGRDASTLPVTFEGLVIEIAEVWTERTGLTFSEALLVCRAARGLPRCASSRQGAYARFLEFDGTHPADLSASRCITCGVSAALSHSSGDVSSIENLAGPTATPFQEAIRAALPLYFPVSRMYVSPQAYRIDTDYLPISAIGVRDELFCVPVVLTPHGQTYDE